MKSYIWIHTKPGKKYIEMSAVIFRLSDNGLF